MEEILVIPNAFSDGSKKAPRPHKIACPACLDLGTILLGGAKREPRTVPEIMQHEAPCTCEAGDLWRALFAEFETPLPAAERRAA